MSELFHTSDVNYISEEEVSLNTMTPYMLSDEDVNLEDNFILADIYYSAFGE